jgi:hypothetical protein
MKQAEQTWFWTERSEKKKKTKKKKKKKKRKQSQPGFIGFLQPDERHTQENNKFLSPVTDNFRFLQIFTQGV